MQPHPWTQIIGCTGEEHSKRSNLAWCLKHTPSVPLQSRTTLPELAVIPLLVFAKEGHRAISAFQNQEPVVLSDFFSLNCLASSPAIGCV
jgi:hypothetical protein